MTRAPYNIHILLYRTGNGGNREYAIFRRADDSKWQGISGGGEDGETILESALREGYEEASLPQSTILHRLDCVSYIPSSEFKASEIWGDKVVVVPMYFFGGYYDGEIKLSHEHSEFKWCSFDEAMNLIYWHDQKNALWELNERLERGVLKQCREGMQIIKVVDKSLADICDELLTYLIKDERKYDKNINENFVVRDWYSTTINNKHRVTFAAIVEGEAIGFIHGLIKEEAGTVVNDTVVKLDALYVKNNNRKQGVGTALIEKFKKWSKEVGAKYIDLSVLVDNCSTVELYRKNGFIPLESYMRHELK